MKLFKHIFTIALLCLAFTACKNDKQPEVKTVETEVETKKVELDPNASYAKAEFTIKGMTCEMGCAKTIEKKLAKMDGVKSATVDFEKELAMVEYDESKVNTGLLTETVIKVGDTYSIEDMKTVNSFSNKKSCPADCKKSCCADKKGDVEKKECPADCKKPCCDDKAKNEEKKTACAKDCKMNCCADKKGKA